MTRTERATEKQVSMDSRLFVLVVVNTFQGQNSLIHRLARLYTLQNRSDQLRHVAFDILSGVVRHENVCECLEALLSSLDAAPLAIGNLTHTVEKLLLPDTSRDIHVLGWKVVDRVDAATSQSRGIDSCDSVRDKPLLGVVAVVALVVRRVTAGDSGGNARASRGIVLRACRGRDFGLCFARDGFAAFDEDLFAQIVHVGSFDIGTTAWYIYDSQSAVKMALSMTDCYRMAVESG